ncbi:Rec8 like protein-domain-containing protein [Obelidium mucronatum]|nr:Rec8 like protein-domain-containing protein [Obelidium mucronatum]
MFQFTFANRTEESGMAVVWIAGTVASGTHAHAAGALRRLSKKDVARVDVRKVCAYIVAPPAPLALRLSSNLMFGASRVLANQMAFLHSDANSVFVRLKKVFSEASTGASITMMATEASAAAITLHIGDENDILSDEAFVDRQLGKERQLGWFIADSNILRNNHSIEERSSSGRASLPVGHGGNDRDSLTMSLLSQPHNPNRSLNAVISIPSVSAVGAGHSNHSLGLVSRRIGIPGSASHSNRSIDFGMGGIGEIDGGGGGEFSGSSGDGSGGLFDYFAGDDDFQAIDNGNLDGFMGEERLNTSFLGNDAGGNEAQGKNVDSIDDQAFNFFEEDAVPDFPITEPIESRKRALEFEGDDNGDFYFNGVDDGTSFGDLRRTSGGSKGTKASTVGSTIVGSKKPKPRKRAKKNFIDAKTELESKDMGVVSRNRQSVVLSLLELEKSQKVANSFL